MQQQGETINNLGVPSQRSLALSLHREHGPFSPAVRALLQGCDALQLGQGDMSPAAFGMGTEASLLQPPGDSQGTGRSCSPSCPLARGTADPVVSGGEGFADAALPRAGCASLSPQLSGLSLPVGVSSARRSPRAPAPAWVAIHGREHGEGSLLARQWKGGYREP